MGMKTPTNQYYGEVVRLARLALAKSEVPIGAIVVDRAGAIIGKGYNQTHAKRDGLRHAELVAIQQAQKYLGDWRLTGTSLYVTLEPCLMCLGAIGNARVKHIYYYLTDPLFGSVESKISKKQIAKIFPQLSCHKLKDDGTVAGLMKGFFQALRKR
jgi:tRNA(adenine34) deaminase